MYQPIINKQPEIQLQKYNKKIDYYIELLNDNNTTENEKKYIMNELKKLESKIISLKQSEEDFLNKTLKEEKELNENKFIEQYKIYIENKKLYYKLLDENNKTIPELFQYLYIIYKNMEYDDKLERESIKNKTIHNIKYNEISNKDKDELNKFITLFNENYNKCNTDIFNIFLVN